MSLSLPLVWRPPPPPPPPPPRKRRPLLRPCFSPPSRPPLHRSAASALLRPPSFPILPPLALPALSPVLTLLSSSIILTIATCFAVLKTKKRAPWQNSCAHSRLYENQLPLSADGFDIVIVGAGVAGSALAYALGKGATISYAELGDFSESETALLQLVEDGWKVLVIERDLKEPDRIVGELLQPGGYLKLVELGLDDCVEDIDAQLVFGYALFKEGKDTKVGYPLKGQGAVVAGRSFHNGRFVQRMRVKAATIPTVRLQQGTALSLVELDGVVKGVRYRVVGENEKEVRAPLTFVCDGCFSNLRPTLCTSKPEVPSWFVGIVLEGCMLPYANHGHVILADPSPILFYQISSTEVRCLVDIPGEKVPSVASEEMGNHLKHVVAPQLPKQLQRSFLAAVERGKVRAMPNKSMPAFPRPMPGALLMGDSFNMRHPLTGGGMTMALSDVVILRDLLHPLHDLHDAAALCNYLDKFYTLRKPVASTINTLAGALYKVFCASSDKAMQEMRHACFEYLSLGGVFSSGPVALLSGMNPRPLSLVAHFFAVAVYGVGRLLLPFPTPRRLMLGIQLIMGASSIILPIIKAEGIRQMFFPNTVPAFYKTPPVESKCIMGEGGPF